MEKLMRGGFVYIFLFTFVTTGFCWPWDKMAGRETQKAPVGTASQPVVKAPVAVPQAVREAARPVKGNVDKERALREKKKGALNNTQWEVEVSALSGQGTKQKDILIFYDNRFSSDVFLKKSFKASNYTMTLQEDGAAIVETMQSSEKEGVVFWRLEFDPNMVSCKGILSRQLADSKSEDFSFVSISRSLYVAPVESPEEARPQPNQEGKK